MNNGRNKDRDASSQSCEDDVDANEVQDLTWAMLDDSISEAGRSRLEQLLNDSDAARGEYLQCVRLHTDLHDMFGAKTSGESPPQTAKSPVLGFLNVGGLPIDVGSHAN